MPGQNQLTFPFVNSESIDTSQVVDACTQLTQDINAVISDVDDDITAVADDLAAATEYTPGNVSDWSGAAPSSLQDALDRIAAAVGPVA